MNSEWLQPHFGNVPQEYQRTYIENLIRQLNTVLEAMQAPGQIVAGDLNLTGLPTTAVGQRAGTVWSDNGTLKIVNAVAIFPVTGASASGSVGTVTVLTP